MQNNILQSPINTYFFIYCSENCFSLVIHKFLIMDGVVTEKNIILVTNQFVAILLQPTM
jgi:hypothetical protein